MRNITDSRLDELIEGGLQVKGLLHHFKSPMNILGQFQFIAHDYTSSINIIHSPTDNCQVASIGGLDTIEEWDCDDSKDLFELFLATALIGTGGKRLFILDLTEDTEELIIELFEPYIERKMKMDYDSTNGSEMSLYLIEIEADISNNLIADYRKIIKKISRLFNLTLIEKEQDV